MIKTIKVKKRLRLDELIKFVWDNAIYPSHFESHAGFKIHFDSRAGIKVDNDYVHSDATVFTVEVEEEITGATKFLGVQEVFEFIPEQTLETEMHPQTELKSIKDVLDEHDEETECLQIYAKVNGKLQLIWERDSDE